MKSQQQRLLSLAAELQTQIENYENHLTSLENFNASIDKSWIEKGEEPSDHYLNESELNFKDEKDEKDAD